MVRFKANNRIRWLQFPQMRTKLTWNQRPLLLFQSIRPVRQLLWCLTHKLNVYGMKMRPHQFLFPCTRCCFDFSRFIRQKMTMTVNVDRLMQWGHSIENDIWHTKTRDYNDTGCMPNGTSGGEVNTELWRHRNLSDWTFPLFPDEHRNETPFKIGTFINVQNGR